MISGNLDVILAKTTNRNSDLVLISPPPPPPPNGKVVHCPRNIKSNIAHRTKSIQTVINQNTRRLNHFALSFINKKRITIKMNIVGLHAMPSGTREI